jgi:hypothetical protein
MKRQIMLTQEKILDRLARKWNLDVLIIEMLGKGWEANNFAISLFSLQFSFLVRIRVARVTLCLEAGSPDRVL